VFARYYSASIGRFTIPDVVQFSHGIKTVPTPHRDVASWNLFAYARNSPVRYDDSQGKTPKDKTKPKKEEPPASQKDNIFQTAWKAFKGIFKKGTKKGGRLSGTPEQVAKGAVAGTQGAVGLGLEKALRILSDAAFAGDSRAEELWNEIEALKTGADTAEGQAKIIEWIDANGLEVKEIEKGLFGGDTESGEEKDGDDDTKGEITDDHRTTGAGRQWSPY